VGSAKLYLHNLPAKGIFLRSLGWQPWLLKSWTEPAVSLAKEIRPSLIRCHGIDLNLYLAYRIKELLGIPYVISLHNMPDKDPINWKERIKLRITEVMRQIALRQADIVLLVYKSIIPYIKRMQVENFEIVYNVLNQEFLRKKDDYHLHQPVRVLSVGRETEGKNPENLIKAIKMLPEVHLTLVGDGTLHTHLQNVVKKCQIEDRVTFYKSIPNDELCNQLVDYDIFATHSDYWGVPKAVMEPLLTGLPVVLNKHKKQPVPEFKDGEFIILVKNTPTGYYYALKRLIENDTFREQLGRKAYTHAQENWAPAKMEAKVVEIYRQIMKKNSKGFRRDDDEDSIC